MSLVTLHFYVRPFIQLNCCYPIRCFGHSTEMTYRFDPHNVLLGIGISTFLRQCLVHLHQLGHALGFGVELAPETVGLHDGLIVLLMSSS